MSLPSLHSAQDQKNSVAHGIWISGSESDVEYPQARPQPGDDGQLRGGVVQAHRRRPEEDRGARDPREHHQIPDKPTAGFWILFQLSPLLGSFCH